MHVYTVIHIHINIFVYMHTHMHVYTHRHRYSIHPHTYMHTDKCIHIHNTLKHIYTSMGTRNTYLCACTHV